MLRFSAKKVAQVNKQTNDEPLSHQFDRVTAVQISLVLHAKETLDRSADELKRTDRGSEHMRSSD